MASFLRYLALLNTGIWLGIALFMFIVAMTIFTAPEMGPVLSEKAARGQLGQIFFHRCYLAQYACAGVALLLLLLEWWIAKADFPKWRFLLLLLIGGLVGGGGEWLAPKLETLLRQKYPEYFQRAVRPGVIPATETDAASREHAKWHRVSEGGFVAATGLLLIYFAATARAAAHSGRSKPRSKLSAFTSL